MGSRRIVGDGRHCRNHQTRFSRHTGPPFTMHTASICTFAISSERTFCSRSALVHGSVKTFEEDATVIIIITLSIVHEFHYFIECIRSFRRLDKLLSAWWTHSMPTTTLNKLYYHTNERLIIRIMVAILYLSESYSNSIIHTRICVMMYILSTHDVVLPTKVI